MLEQIRRCSQSIVVKVLLVMLAGSFFLFFGFSYIVDRLKGNDYVVKIANIKISPQFFKLEKLKKLEMLRRHTSGEVDEKEVSNKILHQIIWENLVNLAAKDFGIIVSDAVMYNYISNMDVFRTEDGHFSAVNLRNFLHKIQVPEEAFMESARREIKTHLIQAPFRYVSLVDELGYFSAIYSEKRSLKFARLKPSSFGMDEVPSREDLEDYYSSHSDGFMIPEKRSFSVMELKVSPIAKDVVLTTEEISDGAREFYGEDYVEGGESDKSFAKTEEFASLKREKVQRSVEEITRQIEDALVSGTSPEEVAKTYNLKIIKVESVGFEDVGSVPLAYSKDAVTTAFGLDEQEVGNFTEGVDSKKEAVQWLVYVHKISPKHVDEFSNVEKEVKKAWEQDRRREKALKVAKQIVEQANAGEDLSKLLFKEGLELERTALFDGEGRVDGKNSDLVGFLCVEAFEKNKGDVSYREEESGDVIVYQVDKISHDKNVEKDNKHRDFDRLRREYMDDMQQQLIGYLSKKYKVEVNYEVLNKEGETATPESSEGIF